MSSKAIQLDPHDNVLVALVDLPAGERVDYAGQTYSLTMNIPAKHKFATEDLAAGAEIRMYGVTVGRAHEPIARGGLLTTSNVVHDAAGFAGQNAKSRWTAPDVTRWTGRTFAGYSRADGQVGTRNYWLVVPLVFCENRNVDALREAFEEELGYGRPKQYREQVRALLKITASREQLIKPMPPTVAGIVYFPMWMASNFWYIKAVAAARAMIRAPYAAFWRATFIIPTWLAQQC